MLAAGELRRRWRSLVAITLLAGAMGAVVLATAAGARRSSSSLHRFVEYSHASDVQVDVERPTRAQIRQLEREPGVRAVSQFNVYAVIPRRFPDLPIAAQVDDNAGTFVDRARLVRGRRADLNAPEDIDIGESL